MTASWRDDTTSSFGPGHTWRELAIAWAVPTVIVAACLGVLEVWVRVSG